MGSRANIVMKQTDGQVVFYSHWGGAELALHLQSALKKGWSRWDDEAYLASIVFTNIVPPNQADETMGFGITTTIRDNQYPILVVDNKNKKVLLMNEELNKVFFEWEFSIYIGMDAKRLIAYMSDCDY